MTQPLGTPDRPLRIAIVGAGPAGLYAAERLLRQDDLVLTIDVFNRFPAPFGLVRDGVAPDHQPIKAVARIFDRVLADPRVRYFGNVTYGVDLHHRELKRRYHQIVYAVGAQADRRMSIPGEDLANSFPAISFVGWYNGHPDYRDLPVDLSCERAVVVGNGNVAMDVTRILATPRRRWPRPTSPTTPWRHCVRARSARSWCSGGAAQPRHRSPPPRSESWDGSKGWT
jgi:ferredoxin/flavodoxin---NADP+ reductase